MVGLASRLYLELDTGQRTVYGIPYHPPLASMTTSDDAGDDDKLQAIITFCDEPRSRAEIQEHLGIKSERYIKEKLLAELLKDGRLTRTIPDKPRSVKQKYIATRCHEDVRLSDRE